MQMDLVKSQIGLTNQKTRVALLKEKLLDKQLKAFDAEHNAKLLKIKAYLDNATPSPA
jgi:hypothetical protein